MLGVLAVVLFGFGAGKLALVLTLPAPAALTTSSTAGGGNVAQTDSPGQVMRDWAPLFGTAARQSAAPQVVAATNYQLRGLVAQAGSGWALIGDGARDTLVRPGDVLSAGETVVEIRSDGVLLQSDSGPRLIAFSAEPDITAATGAVSSDSPVSVRPPTGMTETRNVPLASLRDQDFRTAVARAGGMDRVNLPGGGSALRVLWVRKGQLYDKVGLRQGDVVTAINGMATADTDTIMAGLGTLLQQREFLLDLVRGGRSVALKVIVTE